jgi:L-threonylcarbamoyladenylate synthase
MVKQMIEAIRRGQPVLLPTDTVYGLAASAATEESTARVYELKGRIETQPSALLAGSVEQLVEALPELPRDARVIVETLLPGPFTLVLPNPARRYHWLAGLRSDTLGVRVPDLPPEVREVLAATGPVMATSANEPGGPNPATLDQVPRRIRRAVAAELDVGPLPGTPSTVIDFTRPEPYVIRDGLVPAADAIERVRAALA